MKRTLFLILFLFILFDINISADESVSNKIKIAILSFNSIGDNNLDTETLTETFQTELVNNKNKDFTLVERTQLAKIMEEQKLQLSGITEEDAIKIGSMAGASRIIMANISLWEEKYIVNIKAIDTSTAEIIFADKLESSDKKGLMDLMPEMADRIVRKSHGETIPPYMASEISTAKLPVQQTDENIQTRDLRNKNIAGNTSDKWKPSASMATELGIYRLDIKSTNDFFSANNTQINGGKLNFKFSGDGGFQFILGFDYNSGNLDKNTVLSLFSFSPGILINFINTQYIMFGGGIGYSWGGGDAEYTAKNDSKYKYNFKQETFNYGLEVGVHITKYIIIKLEWGNKSARNFKFQDDSKEYKDGSFTIKTEKDKSLNAPESINSISDGISGSLWALKLDFLFD